MPLNSFTRKLSLAAILCDALGVSIMIGFSIPLISLFMEQLGYDNTLIGLNAAVAALAVLVIGPFVTLFSARLGTVPTLILGNTLSAVGLLLFPFFSGAWSLFLLRALIGFGGALGWIVGETWISMLPSERWRGRVIAVYAIVFGIGLALGPVILNFMGTRGIAPFVFAAALLMVAGLPTLLVYRHAPVIGRKDQRVRVGYALRIAPVGILTAVLSGIAEQSLLGLLALWGLGIGLTTAGAVFLTTLFGLGGVLLMLPMGWLADKTDRFGLLIAVVVLSALCTLALPMMGANVSLLYATMVVLGGAVAGFYALGLTLIGQISTARDIDILSLNTVFVMAYTAGMVVGPVATGTGMDAWYPHGLMLVLTVLFLAFIPLALWLQRRPAVSFVNT